VTQLVEKYLLAKCKNYIYNYNN